MAKAATLFIALFYLLGLSQPSLAEDKLYTPLEAFRVAEGATFPLDNLVTPTGEKVDSKKLLGKRLLINFYTVYCAPCIREVPKLNEIMRRNSDINVLAITPDSAGTAEEYVKKYHLNWPIAAGAKSLLFDTLNVEAFPAFALVDADGKLLATVLANQLGGEDGNATVEGIEKWLNAQSGERRTISRE